MSWERTNQWWGAVREVVAEIEERRDGRLPWRPEFADIFGSREGLVAALRYRWKLIVEAQDDVSREELVDAHSAVLSVIGTALGDRRDQVAGAVLVPRPRLLAIA